jgi:lambda family phage portal protein
MGIRDKLVSMFGGGSAPAIADPVTMTPASNDSAQMGFRDGVDGQRSLAWKNYSGVTWGAGYPSPYYGGAPGSEISRERAVVSAVSTDLVTTNSVIATLVENLTTQAIGNGLTLSAKPDHAALGITESEARALSHQIERRWLAWAGNALEADASGRHTLHQLATASYKAYLLTGESVVALDWRRVRGAKTATKVKLLDSKQLDQSRTQITDNGSAVQGVAFDKDGRLVGYWIIPYNLGMVNYSPMPVLVPAYTSWGRPRVLHLFDLIVPGQIRGLSPLVAALTPAHTKSTLREYTSAGALVQSMMCATVESDSPNALKGLDAGAGGNELGILNGSPPANSGITPEAWAALRAAWYSERGINLNPGVVNHLAANDKLKIHRSETPNSTYDPFDKSLLREGAKAAGASYEDTSGDYSLTSFSASRLALDLPSRINDRRRESIAIRFYRAVYRVWLEEQIETGAIALPKNAPAFWENPDAYTEAKWRGKGKAVADPLKQAQADTLELEQSLTTYEEKLGERGLDLEEVLAQRKAEREMFETAGLNYPVPKNRDDWQPEDDTGSTSK